MAISNLARATEIVTKLNELGSERIGESGAHFKSDGEFVSVFWEDVLLFEDANHAHREDSDFDDGEGFDLTLHTCWRILSRHVDRLNVLTSAPFQD